MEVLTLENNLLLEIKNLAVEYSSNRQIVHAVNDVELKLNKGQTLGLVGETGAGKTTIAKSIIRILPDRQAKIQSGEIWFNDTNLLDISEKQMRKVRGNKISMIFQDPMTALNPAMTVGKQIAEAIILHQKCTKKQADEKAGDMLEMVGIPRVRYKEYPHQFSGGMKQRVVIAMALACQPELLLADEPTTALDVTIQAQVLDMMDNLKHKYNTSMIMITHDLGIVAEVCDYVAVVYAGEVVEYGTTEEVFDNRSHPYTIGLFNSLPNIENTEHRLKPVQGMMPDPTNLPQGCYFNPRCPYATDECRHNKPGKTLLEGEHYVRCIRQKEVRE